MKLKTSAVALIGAALFASGIAAYAQSSSSGVYYRLDTGYSWSTDLNMQDKTFQGVICAPGCAAPGELQNGGNAWIYGLGVGYRFDRSLRADFTLAVRNSYSVKEFDQNNSYFASDIKSWAGLVNGYFDFPIASKVSGYIGAGIGVSYNRVDGLANQTAGIAYPGGDKYDFAWNGMVGLTVPITSSVAVDVGYRYIDLGEVQTEATFGYGGAKGKLRANELQFGLRF